MVALLVRLVVPLAFLVFALLFYANIRDLPIAAKLLPEIMLTVLSVLLVWDLIDEALQWRRRGARRWRDELHVAKAKFVAGGYRPIGTIVLTFGWFFIGMGLLGFYVSTVIFIALGLLLLGERRWWLIALLTVLATAVTYTVFTSWLSLRLPSGMFL